jgi:peptide deformylase
MPQESYDNLVTSMFEVMYDNAGQGLAAPQVRLPYSLFIINSAGRKWVMIDPEVLCYGNRSLTKVEGCLSLPGVVASITRPNTVKIKYFDGYDAWKRGKHTTQQYAGPMGRVVQHEYDHLQGILFTDLLRGDELSKIQPQLKELEAGKGGLRHVGNPLPIPESKPLASRPQSKVCTLLTKGVNYAVPDRNSAKAPAQETDTQAGEQEGVSVVREFCDT